MKDSGTSGADPSGEAARLSEEGPSSPRAMAHRWLSEEITQIELEETEDTPPPRLPNVPQFDPSGVAVAANARPPPKTRPSFSASPPPKVSPPSFPPAPPPRPPPKVSPPSFPAPPPPKVSKVSPPKLSPHAPSPRLSPVIPLDEEAALEPRSGASSPYSERAYAKLDPTPAAMQYSPDLEPPQVTSRHPHATAYTTPQSFATACSPLPYLILVTLLRAASPQPLATVRTTYPLTSGL